MILKTEKQCVEETEGVNSGIQDELRLCIFLNEQYIEMTEVLLVLLNDYDPCRKGSKRQRDNLNSWRRR